MKWPLIFLITYYSAFAAKAQMYTTYSGNLSFKSDAPLELIEADSDKLKGIIDPGKRSFAFSININSFEGFNSPLQREHFMENYMETHYFPKATFVGKIIEKIDFTKDGEYAIRAKGTLTIHGIEQERIIKSSLEIKEGQFFVAAEFSVLLKEHEIRVPKIVHQKIAEEILISINGILEAK